MNLEARRVLRLGNVCFNDSFHLAGSLAGRITGKGAVMVMQT